MVLGAVAIFLERKITVAGPGSQTPSRKLGYAAMTDHERLTADFTFPREYHLFLGGTGDRYFVRDLQNRSVAYLPFTFGGEVRTRSDCWQIQGERPKLTWAVVAHTVPDGAKAGEITEGLIPDIHKLWISSGSEYRVTRNPLTQVWTISHAHHRLVRITDARHFATGRLRSAALSGRQVSSATIATLDSPASTADLGLPILLTLEFIKAQTAADRAAAAGMHNGSTGIY